MTVDITTPLLVLVALPFGASFAQSLARRVGIAKTTPTCTGYPEPNPTHANPTRTKMQHDCESLRSHVCLDGRCNFHCGKTCKCAMPENAR